MDLLVPFAAFTYCNVGLDTKQFLTGCQIERNTLFGKRQCGSFQWTGAARLTWCHLLQERSDKWRRIAPAHEVSGWTFAEEF